MNYGRVEEGYFSYILKNTLLLHEGYSTFAFGFLLVVNAASKYEMILAPLGVPGAVSTHRALTPHHQLLSAGARRSKSLQISV